LPVKNRRSPFEGRALIPRAAIRPRADMHRLVILLLAFAALALSLRRAPAAEATPATDSPGMSGMRPAGCT
jgi:hypothetical protein